MSTIPAEQPWILTAERLHTLSDGLAGNAMLLEEGRVRAVGDLDDLRASMPDAEVVEYPGATITPGLTDSHIHLTEWAVARREADLSPSNSIGDVLQIVKAARARSSGWLVGRGWNAHKWGSEVPDRYVLDAVTSVPAAFQSHDMHALWVNTRALETAGITADTPDPPGGRIVRDDDGAPTGILLETAAQLLIRQIPAPSDEEVIVAVLSAQKQLHQYGITGIHSFPGFHLIEPQPLRILQRMLERDLLRLRVLQHIALDQLDHAISIGLRSGLGGEWIRIGGIKFFLDGTLGSRTAWMRTPYENSADCGVRVLTDDVFRDAVQRAAAAGLSSTVHAIGDAAVSLAFDVLTAKNAQAGTLPNRIEHVQCCPTDRMDFAAREGLVCSMQPCHLINDWRAADRHWGQARARLTYAFRSLRERGAIMAYGSDAPVEPCDPRLGFYAATSRCDLEQQPAGGWCPEECISMHDVLRAYTIGPAHAAGTTAWQGMLAPGYFADFVVWDRDPLQAVNTDLLQLAVRATFVAGQRVYHAE